MVRIFIKWTAFAAFCIFLTACASQTRVSANKAADFTREPKRIFVATNIGDELGAGYKAGFQKSVTELFKSCGVSTEFVFLSPLELDESIYDKKRIAFQADTVLTIHKAGGNRDQYGLITLGIFDAKLIDVETSKVVWRGNLSTSRGGSLSNQVVGESMAVGLTNRLKSDQILRSCAYDARLEAKTAPVAAPTPANASPATPAVAPAATTPVASPTVPALAANTTVAKEPVRQAVAKPAVLGPFKPSKPFPITLDMVRNHTWTYPHPTDFAKYGNIELVFSETGVQATSKTDGSMGSYALRDGALCLSLNTWTSYCFYVVEEDGQKMVFFATRGGRSKLTIN